MIWNQFVSEKSSVRHGWAWSNIAKHLRLFILHILVNRLTIKITEIEVWRHKMAFLICSYFFSFLKHFTLKSKIAQCSRKEVFDGWQQSVIINVKAFQKFESLVVLHQSSLFPEYRPITDGDSSQHLVYCLRVFPWLEYKLWFINLALALELCRLFFSLGTRLYFWYQTHRESSAAEFK